MIFPEYLPGIASWVDYGRNRLWARRANALITSLALASRRRAALLSGQQTNVTSLDAKGC